MRAGCSHLAQSHAGKTALQLAQEERQKEACTILQSVASKVSTKPTCKPTGKKKRETRASSQNAGRVLND